MRKEITDKLTASEDEKLERVAVLCPIADLLKWEEQ